MKYIQIRNAGSIEIEALTLLGASTKRDDDEKIGFFGSGIKYTVAYLLRNDLPFKIFSGMHSIAFDLKEVTLRNQTFQQVTVDGRETSITTSWGENWERWQIFREIVTNAFDEDNFDITLTDAYSPIDSLTTVYLDYNDFAQYYDEFLSYFNVGLVKEKDSKVLLKDSESEMVVFKKGIRIIEEDSGITSLFDYHLHDATLNEERIASLYEMRYCITELLLKCTDTDLIRTVYTAVQDGRKDLFEVGEVFNNLSTYVKFSKAWLEVLNGEESKIITEGSRDFITEEKGEDFLEQHNLKTVPSSFMDHVKTSFGDEFTGRFSPSDEVNADFIVIADNNTSPSPKRIDKLIKVLGDHGIHFNDEVKLVRFKDKWTKAQYEDGIVYLSAEEVNKGDEEALKVLLTGYAQSEYSCQSEEETFLDLLCSVLYHEVV